MGSVGGGGGGTPTQKFSELALSRGLPGTLVPGGLSADMWNGSHAYWLEQHPGELGGGLTHAGWPTWGVGFP